MKFGKEFTSQMVPEWQEAYMNYNYLKTLLKEIQLFREKNTPAVPDDALRRRPTLYRAFSGLIHRQHSAARRHHAPTDHSDVESQTILVTTSAGAANSGAGGRYTTTFMKTAEEGGEYELVYFRRLDEEFNKVEAFYRKKVDEVMDEASLLNKQMEALIAFRIKVHEPSESGHWLAADHAADVEMTRLASDVAASTASLAATAPHSARISGRRVTFMDAIDEGSNNSSTSDESHGKNKNNNNKVVKEERQSPKPEKLVARAGRPAPLEVLNKVTMNKPVETPRSTIKGFLNVPPQTELTFNRDNLKKVESQLKRAFVEFYQKLRLLKSFAFLNTMAFSKIMKKYDKITSRDASKSYMSMVDNSILGSSDEVNKLMERVEATFIKHFSNANRSKGMSVLRPKPKRERHRVTFSTGFFAGCTAALALALILIIRARKLLDDPGKAKYMDTMFPLYSLFGFIVLHILMYAGNVYFWRRYRVNYSFIFGFKAGTELGYRQVLFLGFVLSTLALGAVLSNLDMQLDPKTKDYKGLTELLPLILLLGMAVTLLCPFNIFFRSSRQFFLVCMFHGLAAPLYKVTLPDFFLADQMTSQVQALRSVQFYICYYGWGDYKHRDNTCPSLSVYKTFLFLVAVVPYVSRLMQCLRRLFEEKDPMQGYNGIKYFLTIIAVCMRTAYSIDGGVSWKVMAWIFSISAAVVSMYWDVVIDWGLLQRRSRNRWLRDKLMVPFPSVYFAAIILNTLLRFAWLQTVLNIQLFSLHRQTMVALVASLEIIRRGVWNFFRLENEHLNNVGKYRAFKSVPLPFNYEEEEDDDKDE